jgi:hypothetical protein
MSQTASNPYAAIASHSGDGTEERSIDLPYLSERSESQTQVLISYRLG